MQETIDTSNQYDNDIVDGTHVFMVEEIRKIKPGMYAWKLSFKGDTEREVGEQLMFPNGMGPLLRLLGFQEIEKDKFNWDTENAKGKTFIATISHDPDKKDPSKIRQNMKDFKADDTIPF